MAFGGALVVLFHSTAARAALEDQCSAYVQAHPEFHAIASTCSQTELTLFAVNPTCLSCEFQNHCLDDTVFGSGQECEDVSGGSANGTACLSVLDCNLGVASVDPTVFKPPSACPALCPFPNAYGLCGCEGQCASGQPEASVDVGTSVYACTLGGCASACTRVLAPGSSDGGPPGPPTPAAPALGPWGIGLLASALVGAFRSNRRRI